MKNYLPIASVIALGGLIAYGALPIDAKTAEDAYFNDNGRYIQIQEGSKLPKYESGTVTQKFGKNVSSNVRVDVYDAPDGVGYQIITKNADGTRTSVGYGVEAKERTWETTIVKSATST